MQETVLSLRELLCRMADREPKVSGNQMSNNDGKIVHTRLCLKLFIEGIKDIVALLPTGFGKILIHQLALLVPK